MVRKYPRIVSAEKHQRLQRSVAPSRHRCGKTLTFPKKKISPNRCDNYDCQTHSNAIIIYNSTIVGSVCSMVEEAGGMIERKKAHLPWAAAAVAGSSQNKKKKK